MFYEEVFKVLNRKHVRYLVAGGMAVNLHGVPRMTQDLDLLVDMEKANVLELLAALEELGYRPRLPVNIVDFADEKKRRQWIEKKNMKVFSFFHHKIPVQEIDILVVSPVAYESAVRNKAVKQAGGVRIPTVGIDDLIRMKKNVGRLQDDSDIEMLKKARRWRRGNSK